MFRPYMVDDRSQRASLIRHCADVIASPTGVCQHPMRGDRSGGWPGRGDMASMGSTISFFERASPQPACCSIPILRGSFSHFPRISSGASRAGAYDHAPAAVMAVLPAARTSWRPSRHSTPGPQPQRRRPRADSRADGACAEKAAHPSMCLRGMWGSAYRAPARGSAVMMAPRGRRPSAPAPRGPDQLVSP
jgi:hypothetical protein